MHTPKLGAVPQGDYPTGEFELQHPESGGKRGSFNVSTYGGLSATMVAVLC